MLDFSNRRSGWNHGENGKPPSRQMLVAGLAFRISVSRTFRRRGHPTVPSIYPVVLVADTWSAKLKLLRGRMLLDCHVQSVSIHGFGLRCSCAVARKSNYIKYYCTIEVGQIMNALKTWFSMKPITILSNFQYRNVKTVTNRNHSTTYQKELYSCRSRHGDFLLQ